MSGWTPGPWHKSQTDKGRPKVVDRSGFTIATAGAQPYNHSDFDLMAASQDLYAALEAFVNNSSVQVNQPYECERAEAALAKARGEGAES